MDCQHAFFDVSHSEVPTLEKALQLQETAAAIGLDWPKVEDVWSRINEELAEAKAASEDISILGSRIAARAAQRGDNPEAGLDKAHDLLVDELGELLFAVVDVCRILGVNPDQALDHANAMFGSCFKQIEEKTRRDGRLLCTERPSDLKRLWDQTKQMQREKASSSNIIWSNVGRCASSSPESIPFMNTAGA